MNNSGLWNNCNLRANTCYILLYILIKGFPFAPLAQVLHCGHGGQRPKKEDSEDPRSPNHVHLQSQVLQLSLCLIKLRTGLINNVLIDP